jgi:hypothetical protein
MFYRTAVRTGCSRRRRLRLHRVLSVNGPGSRFFDPAVLATKAERAAVYTASWTVPGINRQFLCNCFVELGTEVAFPGKLRRVMRRYRLANTPPEKRKYLRKSQLWLEDFTAKLFCNVEFWMERLPKLIGLSDNAAIDIPNSGLAPFMRLEFIPCYHGNLAR